MVTTTEATSSPASDTDTTAAAENDGSDDGGDKGGKGEDEDGENNGEEEEEDEEKGAESKDARVPDDVEKQANGSVTKDPPTAVPDSTAKEKGENSTAPSSVPEDHVETNTHTIREEDTQVLPTRDPMGDDNVTAVIETPDNTAYTSKPSREDRKHVPPFSILTG